MTTQPIKPDDNAVQYVLHFAFLIGCAIAILNLVHWTANDVCCQKRKLFKRKNRLDNNILQDDEDTEWDTDASDRSIRDRKKSTAEIASAKAIKR